MAYPLYRVFKYAAPAESAGPYSIIGLVRMGFLDNPHTTNSVVKMSKGEELPSDSDGWHIRREMLDGQG